MGGGGVQRGGGHTMKILSENSKWEFKIENCAKAKQWETKLFQCA